MADERAVKERIRDQVEDLSDALWEVALDLHRNPEIGHREHRSAERLTSFLRGHGFSVESSVAGMETSFRASWSSGEGPTVAILAEYDALPGMGHACGHNIIATAGVGAGVALKRAMEACDCGLEGTLLVLGCPAEEGAVDDAGGKVIMVEEGVFDEVDCAMMIHPSTATGSRGSSLAREAMEITYHGKAAHAAGSPEKGKNALEAAILTFNAWNALRQHLTDDVRIHGVITEGGHAPNIVPDFTQIRMYVRAEDVGYLEEVVERVRDCARGGALVTGCRVEFRRTANRYANMISNATLADAFSANFQSLGEKIDDTPRAGGGSTDMGNVSQAVPSIHPYVAIAPPGVAGHSTEFLEAAASDEGRRGMELGAAALAMTALDCLTDPALRTAIAEEFEAR